MIAAALSLTLMPATPTVAADVATRSVRGQIVAIDPAAAPPVIVITARTPKNEELIVGATIDEHTTIVRGEQAVRLEDLKEGESVTLRYLKTDDGLVARLIRAE